MANVSWIFNGDGDWSTAADWSGGAVPGSNDNVTINTTSLHTVTHSTGNDFVLTLTVKNDHFNMTGGSLTIGSAASFSTGFNQSGGAFLGSGAVAIAGGATLLGGYAGGALTLTVNGAIALANYTLGGAASLVNTSTTNETGQVGVGDNTGVNANITNQAGATFNISGDFGLSSGAASAAFVNAGTLAKSAGVGTSLIALTLDSTGVLQAQSGTLELDAAGDTIGGTLAGAGQIAFGGGYVYTLAAGTVATAAGIDLYNTGATLTLGGNLSYAGALNETGGTLIALGGHTLTLNGASSLSSTVNGAGTLATTGGVTTVAGLTVAGGTNWTNSGAVDEIGPVQIGDGLNASTLTNRAGGVYTFGSNDGIEPGGDPASSLVNAGTLAKTFAGVSYVDIAASSTGVINAGVGATIEFRAVGDGIGGTLAGAGEVAFGGSGATTLAAGLIATVAQLSLRDNATVSLGGNLAYGGNFYQGGGGTTLYLDGHTLSLTGPATFSASNYCVVDAGGATSTVTTSGATGVYNLTIGSGVSWTNSGTISESGAVTVGDSAGAATLTNQAGGVYQFTTGAGLYSGNAASSLVNAGTLQKTNAGTSQVSVNTASTGTVNAGAGADIAFYGDNTLSGTLSGAGEIDFTGGGSTTLASGTSLAVAALDLLSNATLVLGGAFTYAGSFTAASNGATLDLAGHSLTLTGPASLYSNNNNLTVNGGGALNTSGATYVAGLTLGGGDTWTNSGAVTEGSNIWLGDGSAGGALVNKAGATVMLAANQGIGSNNSASTISNAGTLGSASGGNNYIGVATNNTGTINAVTGSNIYFQVGGNVLGGSLAGAGQIAVVQNGAATLSAAHLTAAAFGIYDNAKVTLGRNITYKTGNFYLNGGGVALYLNGFTLTVNALGIVNQGNYPYIDGSGTLNTTGSVALYGAAFDGGLVWNNTGTVSQGSQNINVGGVNTTVNNEAGGVWNIQADVSIGNNGSPSATFNNAGTLAKTGGTGISYIGLDFNNTGTINTGNGTIQIGGASNTVGGTITGAGQFTILGGATTLAAGTAIDAALTVAYNGTVVTLGGDETAGAGLSDGFGTTLNLNGHTLTADTGAGFYSANYETPTIEGPGEFVTTGATSVNALVIGGTATWANSGVITMTNGPLQIGDGGTGAATLNNAAGGSLLLANDYAQVSRGAVSANLIVNAGLFAKTGGTSTSTVSPDVTSTGTISCASGNLAFNGANNTFAGMVTGAGQVALSGGATTLAAGVTISVANFAVYNDGTSVTLGGALTYAGNFAEYNGTVFNLAGHSLTFTGSVGIFYANYGTPTFNGGGTLNTHGATAIGSFVLGGGVNWNNYGAVTVNGSFQIGDAGPSASTVVNKVGASVLIEADQAVPTIGSGLTVGSTFINDGTLGKIGGGGGLGGYHSRVAVGVTNAGVIEAYSGDFEFQGAVTGAGTAIIDNGAALQLDSAVSAGQSIGFGAGGGTLYLGDATAFSGGLSSFGSNCAIDLGGFGYNPPTETITVTSTEITVTDGSKVANIQLFAQFSAGFHIANDGGGGTLILSGSGALKQPLLTAARH